MLKSSERGDFEDFAGFEARRAPVEKYPRRMDALVRPFHSDGRGQQGRPAYGRFAYFGELP